MRKYIDAARIAGRKNLDGRLAVIATAGLPLFLSEGMEAHFVPPVIDAPRHGRVISVAPQGDGGAVVAFEGIGDAETAEMLVGCHCLVSRDAVDDAILEACEASLVPELEGWALTDVATGRSGTIVEVQELPGQVMLGVAFPDDREAIRLVPLADDLVVGEDPAARSLAMRLPDGMLDL